jgi:recombination associated protein RdgC
MFKNALVYRIDAWSSPTVADVEARLASARFVECGATQQESVGWIEPRGEANGALVEAVAGQWILKLCSETKAVPSSVVKLEMDAQLDKIEKDSGHRPKGKAIREVKEDIVHKLLPRAFPKRSPTLVWIDARAQQVWIAAGSAKKADKVVRLLVELMGSDWRLSAVQTDLSPTTAMTSWLSDKAAPSPFSLDRECELKQADGEKATVRYSRHNLEIDELGAHIQAGKWPTQVAMTWNGRVSFVLTESLTLKKIKLLDTVIEGQNAGADKADSGFDADVAISTGELRLLWADLLNALGGELAEVVPKPAAPAQTAAANDNPPWSTTQHKAAIPA